MKRLFMFIIVIVGITILVAGTGCNTGKKDNLTEFYYYPKTNMYFDVAKNNYIYSLDGAKTWDTLDATNENQPVTLGEKQVIYSGPDSVWKDNEAHRNMYGGKLYDVFAGDTALVDTGEVTDKIVATKNTSSKKEVDKKPRKGLGKFLNKIFGKRKEKSK